MSEGSEGWVFHSLLVGQAHRARGAVGAASGQFPAHARRRCRCARSSPICAPKVIADVEECTGSWCVVSVEGYEGWIEQESLWGVYPDGAVRGVDAS